MTTAGRTESFEGRVARFRIVNAWWIQVACYALEHRAFARRVAGARPQLRHPVRPVHDDHGAALGDAARAVRCCRAWPCRESSMGLRSASSIVVGVTVGLALARIKLIAAAFEPYMYILYATPTISLVPFVSVMFGFEFGSRVLVAVLISIFPILLGVMEGARSIPRQHLDVAAIFGSSEGAALARRDRAVRHALRDDGHQAVDRAGDGRDAGRGVLPQSRRRGGRSPAGHQHDRLRPRCLPSRCSSLRSPWCWSASAN